MEPNSLTKETRIHNKLTLAEHEEIPNAADDVPSPTSSQTLYSSSVADCVDKPGLHSLFSRKSSITPSDIKVLVIDDDLLSKKLLVQYLRRANYQVDSHDTPEDALARVITIESEESSYHLIIFSASLPNINGPDFILQLRAHPVMREVPVIVLASPQETELAYRCLKAGADDYILKPIRMEVIKGVWQSVWRRRSEKKILRMLEDELRFRVEIEQKIGQLQDQVVLAIETPVTVLTRAISELMQDSTISSQSKTTLLSALNALTSSNLHRPTFEKALLDPNVDRETRLWISKELLGGQSVPMSPLDIPADWPNSELDNESMHDTSSVKSLSFHSAHSRSSSHGSHEDAGSLFSPNVMSVAPNSSPSRLGLPSFNNLASRRLTAFNAPTSLKIPEVFTQRASMPDALVNFSRNESPNGLHEDILLATGSSYSFSVERVARLRQWEFDLFQYTEMELIHYIIDMFHEFDLINHFGLSVDILCHFLLDIRAHYHRENPYHNFRHAFDLTQAVFCFIADTEHLFSKTELLSLFIACICHDLEHPGKTNNFLVSCESALALRYNDQSVLENYHCYQTFVILRKKENYFLHDLPRETLREIRNVITRCILATDLALHVDLMAKFTAIGTSFEVTNKKHRLGLLEALIKCGDISNPLRPLVLAKYWSDIIQEEQFLQGDMERQLGMPITAFADRQNPQQARMSLSFIDFMITPLFNASTTLLPSLRLARPYLTITREYWVKILETAEWHDSR